MNEFFIDEILHFQSLDWVIHIDLKVKPFQPAFPLIGHFLVKSQVDRLLILLITVSELNLVFLQVRKILLSLTMSWRSQSLIVLDFPVSIGWDLPQLVVCLGEEIYSLSAVLAPDDRGHELFQEPVDSAQWWPECLEEVYDQALYVRPVDVLVRHYHHWAIPQRLNTVVLLAELQSQYFYHVR